MMDASFFFDDAAAVSLLVRLALGAVASFFAILSWTRTRSLYWVFVIVGILSAYAGTLYNSLRVLGLFPGNKILVLGIPAATLISENLSIVFFILACIAYIKTYK